MKKLPCIFLVGKKNLDGPTWHLATLNRKCHATERNVVAFLSRLPPPFSRLPPSDGPTSPLQSPPSTLRADASPVSSRHHPHRPFAALALPDPRSSQPSPPPPGPENPRAPVLITATSLPRRPREAHAPSDGPAHRFVPRPTSSALPDLARLPQGTDADPATIFC